MSVTSGTHYLPENNTISISGNESYGINIDDYGSIFASGANIKLIGNNNFGISVNNGAKANLTNSTVNISGTKNSAIYFNYSNYNSFTRPTYNSDVTFDNNTTITVNGDESYGLAAQSGIQKTFDPSNQLPGIINVSGNNSAAFYVSDKVITNPGNAVSNSTFIFKDIKIISGINVILQDSSWTGIAENSGGFAFQGVSQAENGRFLIKNQSAINFADQSAAPGSLIELEGGSLDVNTTQDVTIGTLSGADGTVSLTKAGLILNGSEQTAFNGIIQGNYALHYNATASGSLTLTGISTYTGGTYLNSGTLIISQNNNLGSGTVTFTGGTLGLAGNLTLAAILGTNGGTIDVATGKDQSFSGILSGTGSLTKTGSGALTLTGTNTYSGGTFLNSGTVLVSSDTNLGTAALTFNGGTLSLAGNLTKAATLATNGGTINVAANTNQTYSGVISGQGNLTKAGSGTLSLTGVNTYTGSTQIDNGILSVSADNNLGAVTSALTINSGTLQLGASFNSNRSVQLAQAGTFDSNGYNNIFSGKFDGSGSLIKTGNGTLTLSGNNNYSGGTTLNAGTLAVSGGSSLGTGALNLNAGILQLTGNVSFSGAIVLNNNGSIETNAGTKSIFSGVVSGTGGLVQTGSGTLTLSGTNTYAKGTVINDGVLVVSKDANLGVVTGALTLNGGTLSTGDNFTTTRNIQLNGNGTITARGANTVLSGDISGSGKLSIIGSDNNSPITLSGANSYTGGTIIGSQTTLLVNSDENLGAGSGDLTLKDYVILRFTNQFDTNRNIHLSDIADAADWIDTNGNNGSLNGIIDGAAALVKDGDGTLTLTALNTYQGGTYIYKGILVVSKDETLGDKTGILFFDGGILKLGGANFTTARNVHLEAGGVIDTNNFGSIFGGIIEDGDDAGTGIHGQLTKTGAGILTLSGTNTYTGGTVIKGGAISVSADTNLGVSTGALTLDSGTLQLSNSFDNSRTVTLDTGGGTIQTSLLHSNIFSGMITGTGKLTKSGEGTLILSGNNTYTGNTALNAGTLSVNTDNNLGDSAGVLTFSGGTLRLTGNLTSSRMITLNTNGTIETAAGTNSIFSGIISGTGQLLKTGTGTLTLSGTNSYSGGTVINTGTLSVSTDANLGDPTSGIVFKGGTLLLSAAISSNRALTLDAGGGTINTAAATISSLTQGITGSGKLTKSGDGTLILTGTNSYSGTTTIAQGMLQIGDGGSTGSLTGTIDITAGAALTFNRNDQYTYSDIIKGTGTLNQQGSGTLTLTGENSYTGGTTISAGTLEIGNGGTGGSITGNVTNNGILAFNRSNALDFSGIINGTGTLQHNGSGILTLSGDSSTFSGTTNANTGTLLINGSLGGTVNVASGAGLGGSGTIGGDTTISDGAKLFGAAGQVLTLSQNLLLNSHSTTEVSFSGAGQASLFRVNGDLTLGGIINITSFGDDGPGVYTVFDYSGQLHNNPLTVGTVTAGQDQAKITIQTNQTGKINLVNSNGGALTFWDGDNPANHDNGILDGGDGVWINDPTNNNWTDHDYTINGEWADSGFAIFAGTSGTVTVDNSSGAIKASGIQFQIDGYVIKGDVLTLVSPDDDPSAAPIMRVGGGLNDSNITATIAANLTGASGMRKTYAGRLILTAGNQYTGGTFVTGGVLQLGDGTINGKGSVLGDISLGSTALSAGVLEIKRAGSVTINNDISGTGHVVLSGTGETELTGNNSYLAGTFIQSGTLIITNDNNLGAAGSGVQIDEAVLRFNADFTDTNSFSHLITLTSAHSQLDTNGHSVIINGAILSDSGLTKTGDGTLILTYNNAYDGGTTISQGILQIGNGGASGTLQSNVINNGILAFNRADPYAFQGVISGNGSVEQNGTGTLTLTATNTYKGGTIIKNGGRLAVSSDTNLGNSTGSLIIQQGVLQNTASFMINRAIILGSGSVGFDTAQADLTLAASLSGSNDWSILNGRLIITGDGSAATGKATIDAGHLQIDGTLGGSAVTSHGGAISGNGRINGNVSVSNGTLYGQSGRILTIGGSLTLAGDSTTNVTLGTPAGSALFKTAGDLTLGGTLNIIDDIGGFGAGVYRIFDYSGSLNDSGIIIGTIPAGTDASGLWIQTNYEHQVNLVNQNGVEVTFWNAEGDRDQNNQNNTITGGSGIWDTGNDNWTENDKGTQQGHLFNARWKNGSFAVFGGNAGTVTIDRQNGAISATGLNFVTDGYVLSGDPLILDNGTGILPVIRVGTGQADAGIVTTITSELQGTNGLRKTDYGTLILTADNDYGGGTTISGGILQIGDGGNNGSITGDVIISGDGTLLFNRGDDISFAENISGDGKGGLVQRGSGTLTLSANNLFSGGLTVESGAVKAGTSGHSFGTGALKLKAGATADLDSFDTTLGGLTAFDTTETTGDGDITLGTAKLTIAQSFDSSFTGLISGTGDLIKSGAGTLTLSGINSYSGLTNIETGTLKQGTTGSFNTSSSGFTIGVNGMLNLGGFDTTLAALSNDGLITTGVQTAGTTLTVNGDYSSNDGTVILNTVLGDDTSATDHLQIQGNSSGTTNLQVKNRGGSGAQTIRGITLVGVAGRSDGTFSLISDYTTKDGQKAVVGGAFAYTLHQGQGENSGSWYLTSQNIKQDPDPDPDCKQNNSCSPNPTPRYSAAVPLYQGYIPTLQALNTLPTLQQRNKKTTQQNGIWGRIEGTYHHFDTSRSTTGMRQNADIYSIQAGIDGQLAETENGILTGGFTTRYGTAGSHITSGYGDGTIDAQGWGIGSTLTWYGDSGFYFDTQAQAMWYDSNLTSGTAKLQLANGNKGFGYSVSFETGKRIELNTRWSVTPQVQLIWSSIEFDSFKDAWNTPVSNDQGNSLNARLGLSADHRNMWHDQSGRIRRSNIYVIANFYQEFMGAAQIDVAGTPVANDNDQLWGGIGAGGTYTWHDDRFALFGEGTLNTSLQHFANSYMLKGTIGLKIHW